MRTSLVVAVFLFCCLILNAAPVGASSGKPKPVVSEDYFVKASDPGIQIFVRNKHLKGAKDFTADRIVLFVHGSTYPADTSFDLPLDGLSWMDYIAQRGFDVYLLDLRGYGRSTRPPEMSQPAEKNPPIVRTDIAVKDVAAVVDSILARRKVSKINLIGWSWGTTIMATYTSQHNDKVQRLVLYAAQWLRTTPPLVGGGDGPLGAYRTVTMSAAKARWLTGVPEDKKKDLIPAGWFEQWAAATQASDPEGAAQNPPVLRAPNGTVQDSRDYWMKGKPVTTRRRSRSPCWSSMPSGTWIRRRAWVTRSSRSWRTLLTGGASCSAKERTPSSWSAIACTCSARCNCSWKSRDSRTRGAPVRTLSKQNSFSEGE